VNAKDASKGRFGLGFGADRPLGAMAALSALTELRSASGPRLAAETLLGKAFEALESGDLERVSRYVDHAARLDYDELEECHMGAWVAHQMLYDEVTDALDDSDPGDTRWLDSALTVLEGLTGVAAADLAAALRDIAADYELTPAESKRIRRLPQPPHEEDAFGLARDATPEQRAVVIRALLDATLAFHLAHHHSG
jgi:hypothetical protein